MTSKTITFTGEKGSITLTQFEVEEMIRWYEGELRKMDRPGTRYTEWHRLDYARTVADYRARLEAARSK